MPGADSPRTPRDRPLGRLTDALRAYVEHVQSQDAGSGVTDAEFLASHGDKAEILEPLLEHRDEIAPGRARRTPAPRYLGDFRLVRELGRGGMGVVFEAEQVSLGRRVALKVLPPYFSLAAGLVHRFRREAAAAARISHPGVVPIYAVGETEGTHWFAMELVEGSSLAELLHRARAGDSSQPSLDALDRVPGNTWNQRCAEVVRRCALALHAAHAQGVLHRDVKPHNILLDRAGRPRLVDFGLAKDLSAATVTKTGTFAGTLHYMSPEQVLGDELDARADVYSLGMVLYEMLALRLPFASDSGPRVLAEIASSEPLPPSALRAQVESELDHVCLRALAKDRARRYPSAQEFADDLQRYLNGEPTLARRHCRRPSPLRRNLWLGIAAVVLAAGVVWAWWSAARRERTSGELAAAATASGESTVVPAVALEFGRDRAPPALTSDVDESPRQFYQPPPAGLPLGRSRPAALDREIDTAVGAIWLTACTPADVQAFAERGFRLTMAKVWTVEPLRFVCALVGNQREFERSNWSWLPSCSGAELAAAVQPGREIVDVEPYVDAAGTLRYAAVFAASRSPREARVRLYSSLPAADLRRRIESEGQRIVDLEAVQLGSSWFYSALTVPSEGDTAREWCWLADRSVEDVEQACARDGWQILDLERIADDRVDAILLRAPRGWGYVINTDLEGVSQHMRQSGNRLIELEVRRTRDGVRVDACTVNNSDQLTARLGARLRAAPGSFGFVLQRVAGGSHDVALLNWEEAFDGDLLADLWRAIWATLDFSRRRPLPWRGGRSVSESVVRRALSSRTVRCIDLQGLWRDVAAGAMGVYQRSLFRELRQDLAGPGFDHAGLSEVVREEAARLQLAPAPLRTFLAAIELWYARGACDVRNGSSAAATGLLTLPMWSRGRRVDVRYVFSCFVHRSSTAATVELSALLREMLRDEVRAALATWLDAGVHGEVRFARTRDGFVLGYPAAGQTVLPYLFASPGVRPAAVWVQPVCAGGIAVSSEPFAPGIAPRPLMLNAAGATRDSVAIPCNRDLLGRWFGIGLCDLAAPGAGVLVTGECCVAAPR